MNLIRRNDLRLAFLTGLVNAFGSISGIADSYYAALTVPAVLTGTYGGSIEMGRQRILGSILGALILLVGLEGLQGIPMPVALALSVGSLRFLGGILGLKVGYKAGGMLLIMGWLLHSSQLGSWIPLRLAWTLVGIVAALVSLRLFWPDRARDRSLQMAAALTQEIQDNLIRLAERLDPAQPQPAQPQPANAGTSRGLHLRNSLNALRRMGPDLLRELGSNPKRHPAYRLIQVLTDAHSRLAGSLLGLERHAPAPAGAVDLLLHLHQAEHDLLQALAARLALWSASLAAGSRQLPQPPPVPLAVPSSWLLVENLLSDPTCNQASLERLERIATRLVLCRQAQQAIETAELRWAALLNG
jgi:hypothetical protein